MEGPDYASKQQVSARRANHQSLVKGQEVDVEQRVAVPDQLLCICGSGAHTSGVTNDPWAESPVAGPPMRVGPYIPPSIPATVLHRSR